MTVNRQFSCESITERTFESRYTFTEVMTKIKFTSFFWTWCRYWLRVSFSFGFYLCYLLLWIYSKLGKVPPPKKIIKQLLRITGEGFYKLDAFMLSTNSVKKLNEIVTCMCYYVTWYLWFFCCQGKLRGKKLQSLINRISPQSDLGPYAGGSYTSPSGVSVTLELVPIGRLQSGVNAERVVVGRTVCSICMESAVTLYVLSAPCTHGMPLIMPPSLPTPVVEELWVGWSVASVTSCVSVCMCVL